MKGESAPGWPGLRADRGAASIGTLVVIALGAIAAYLLLAAPEGDPDSFGEVPIPGRASVDLPDGQTDVYYSEGIDSDSGVELAAPDDLDIAILSEDGELVRIDSRGGEPEESGDATILPVAAAFPPDDGTYTVEVRSPSSAQRILPTLTFGQSPIGAIGNRLEGILDALVGPLGVLLLLAAAAFFVVPRVQRARRRT